MEWTDKDKDDYEPIGHIRIEGMYDEAGIDRNNPEERTRYLTEEILSLSRKYQELVERIAIEKGNSAALNFLEEMAVKRF